MDEIKGTWHIIIIFRFEYEIIYLRHVHLEN